MSYSIRHVLGHVLFESATTETIKAAIEDAMKNRSANVQLIDDLSRALIKIAGEVMESHGNDPQGLIILAAGFALALQNIGKHIDPIVPKTVHAILKE